MAAEPIESMLMTYALRHLARQPVPPPPPPDVAPDLEEVAEVEARLAAIGEAFAAGDVTLETLTAAQAALRGRLEGARERVAAKTVAGPPRFATEEDFLAMVPWMDIDRRIAVLSAVFVRIVVKPAPRRGAGFDPDRVGFEARYAQEGGGVFRYNLD